MWYFAWILGLPFAALFAVLNAMWYEMHEEHRKLEAGVSRALGDRGSRDQ